jgi:hypothetical protein
MVAGIAIALVVVALAAAARTSSLQPDGWGSGHFRCDGAALIVYFEKVEGFCILIVALIASAAVGVVANWVEVAAS